MDREGIIRRARTDRWWAHRLFFGHRHSAAAATFHRSLVEGFWGPERYREDMAFRGGAKSTYLEEYCALGAAEGLFRNCVIVGSTEGRAAERLASVSYELETNDLLNGVYGEQAKGSVWTQTKLVTRFGVCIQALGRDQDIRGIKHLEQRPDLVLADDFEDRDSVQTAEGRKKTLRWFLGELLPACDPLRKIRVVATPMDPESVPMLLIKDAGWPHAIYPIEVDGEPTWPDRYGREWIEEEKRVYLALGEGSTWAREYMCEAVSEASRTFKPGDLRVVPRERTWHRTWAMIDPARTRGVDSATTGWAVWSWVQNRLIVWDAGAAFLLPDEIVELGFRLNERWELTRLGVEEDGLNEFLLQPFRHEQARRGLVLPLEPRRAPRGKLDFIRGLQPFFASGEAEFAADLPELRQQMTGFPTGRIDAPNALAYALPMRPGLPVYEGFGSENVSDIVPPVPGRQFVLALNAGQGLVTAVLLQASDGVVRVFADWVREGDAAALVPDMVSEASFEAGAHLMLTCPPEHFNEWSPSGLAAACRRIPARPQKGAAPEAGRVWLRECFERRRRGEPCVRLGSRAVWTLNAIGGGYAWGLKKGGGIQAEAQPGVYRVLMEGVESCLGLLTLGVEDDEDRHWAYTKDGRRYLSALGRA